MVVEWLLTFFRDVAVWALGLLPDWDPPDVSAWASSAASVWTFTGWLNQYIPVTFGLVLLAILLAIWLGNFLLRFVLWIATKAHLLGGSSDG